MDWEADADFSGCVSIHVKGSNGSLHSSAPQSLRRRVHKLDQAMEWAEELNDLSFSASVAITGGYSTSCKNMRGQRCIWPQSGMQTKEGHGLEGLETDLVREIRFSN